MTNKELREKQRKQKKKMVNRRYYRRTQRAKNTYKRWTQEELRIVYEHKYTDHELAEMLGRSVMAIQLQRTAMKKKERDEVRRNRI